MTRARCRHLAAPRSYSPSSGRSSPTRSRDGRHHHHGSKAIRGDAFGAPVEPLPASMADVPLSRQPKAYKRADADRYGGVTGATCS